MVCGCSVSHYHRSEQFHEPLNAKDSGWFPDLQFMERVSVLVCQESKIKTPFILLSFLQDSLTRSAQHATWNSPPLPVPHTGLRLPMMQGRGGNNRIFTFTVPTLSLPSCLSQPILGHMCANFFGSGFGHVMRLAPVQVHNTHIWVDCLGNGGAECAGEGSESSVTMLECYSDKWVCICFMNELTVPHSFPIYSRHYQRRFPVTRWSLNTCNKFGSTMWTSHW